MHILHFSFIIFSLVDYTCTSLKDKQFKYLIVILYKKMSHEFLYRIYAPYTSSELLGGGVLILAKGHKFKINKSKGLLLKYHHQIQPLK